jgi:hypothetical protein
MTFIVYGLPRSRTAWLARYLSYGDYECSHEHLRHIRSINDAKLWLSQDCVGTAETSAARWWRVVQHLRPDIRTVVVRRPVAEVVDSLMRLDMRGVCTFDRAAVTRAVEQQDRALDRIERQPGVLSVQFADLASEATCRAVFEHCLPYPHDRAWWAAMDAINVQASMPHLMRYCIAHRAELDRAGSTARAKMRHLLTPPARIAPDDGMTFQVEPFDVFWRDASALLADHCESVGEPRDQWTRKNVARFRALDAASGWHIMTARCNGRMFGYLASIVSPSMENPGETVATQTTFYASPDAPRLGIRLERESIADLWRRGADEIWMRAGVRGSGPNLGIIYRRMGAEPAGELYRLRRAS